jgi:hypothetical protein
MIYIAIIIDYIPVALLLFSIYSWWKYREAESVWWIVLSGLLCLLKILGFYKKTLNLSPQANLIVNSLDLLLGVAIFIGFMAVLYIFRERKITFKKDKGLKGYHRKLGKLPQLMQINPQFKSFDKKEQFPYTLVIQLEIVSKDKLGLPKGKEEIEILDTMEDDIEKDIKSNSKSYFLGRMTFDGFRYIYYQIDNDEKVMAVLMKIDTDKPIVRRFYTSVSKDPLWEKVTKYFNVRD